VRFQDRKKKNTKQHIITPLRYHKRIFLYDCIKKNYDIFLSTY